MTLDDNIAERLKLSSTTKSAGRNRKWLWISGAILVVIVIGFFLFFPRSGRAGFITQTVTRGSLIVSVSATGTLAPRDQVDVGAEVSGRIEELYVDFNDHVTKGQKLAQINTQQLEAQLGQAKASLMQSEATLAQNEANLKRDEALLKINALSPQQYDTARADYFRAKAGVAQAAAVVKADETQISKATIYAPIDGVVLDRKVSRGQTVVAAMTTPVLYTLASDLSRMELDVDIDEADVGSVHPGQSASFTVDAYPGRTFSAALISVRSAPQTTNNVVTYKGVLLVDNAKLLLKPGMTATAEIVTGKTVDALLVPNAALRFVPPATLVRGAPPAPVGANRGRAWTERGPRLVPHDLKLGGTNGHFTEVIAGDLKPGDKVVTDSKVPAAP